MQIKVSKASIMVNLKETYQTVKNIQYLGEKNLNNSLLCYIFGDLALTANMCILNEQSKVRKDVLRYNFMRTLKIGADKVEVHTAG